MPPLAITLFGATVSGKELAIVAVVVLVILGVIAFALMRTRGAK